MSEVLFLFLSVAFTVSVFLYIFMFLELPFGKEFQGQILFVAIFLCFKFSLLFNPPTLGLFGGGMMIWTYFAHLCHLSVSSYLLLR